MPKDPRGVNHLPFTIFPYFLYLFLFLFSYISFFIFIPEFLYTLYCLYYSMSGRSEFLEREPKPSAPRITHRKRGSKKASRDRFVYIFLNVQTAELLCQCFFFFFFRTYILFYFIFLKENINYYSSI